MRLKKKKSCRFDSAVGIRATLPYAIRTVVVKPEVGIYTIVMSPLDPVMAGSESFVYTVCPTEHNPLGMLALKSPGVSEVTFTVILHRVLEFRLGHAVWPSFTAVRKVTRSRPVKYARQLARTVLQRVDRQTCSICTGTNREGC